MGRVEVRIIFSEEEEDAKSFQRLICVIRDFFKWESMMVNIVELEKEKNVHVDRS